MVNFSSAAGNFVVKTVYGASGLGVTGGRTGDEIDVGETITMSWANALTIKNFTVSVLFNGPEYDDWSEVAQVSAYNGATLLGVGRLQVAANLDDAATFTGTGFGSVSNLSLADDSHGGAWSVSNPFGNAAVTSLVFTALDSTLCGRDRCGNQSDYTLSSVTAVPEPGSLPLMVLALGLCGLVVRRARLPR